MRVRITIKSDIYALSYLCESFFAEPLKKLYSNTIIIDTNQNIF